MSLQEYKRKRDFDKTSEPEGSENRTLGNLFVVQKHAARRLHYDFRLELDGVLKSWAVPKGPSLDPAVKSLAVQVEDHPLEYATFEGIIPAGQYGGGTVMVWDQGTWSPLSDARKALKKGKLSFHLQGEKLSGDWTLVRMHGNASDLGKNWLLIKKQDESAQDSAQFEVTAEQNKSVISDRTLDGIATDADRVWSNNGKKKKISADIKNRKQTATSLVDEADIRKLSEAHPSHFPDNFNVQLATLATKVPLGDQWLHELKLDGYRIVTLIENKKVHLMTRHGNDWTKKFPEIVRAIVQLPIQSAILDGEVVAVDSDGIADFQRLQNWLKGGEKRSLFYYVFDLPFINGYDLQKVPLVDRKQLLAKVLLADNPDNLGEVRYNDHIRGKGESVIDHACRSAMEGVVSKLADSTYQGRRSRSWLKIKCLERQEFVIGGFTKPSGSRTGFGALLLGYYDKSELIYCGRVGTGFTSASLRQIKRELDKHQTPTPPFANPPTGGQRRGVTWLRPALVAEVEFAQWTDDGILRHAVFHGLREDKAPEEIVREDSHMLPRVSNSKSQQKLSKSKSEEHSVIAGVHLTHPERVLYPDQGITKRRLAQFYESIADLILPHILGRPLSLVRCPRGRQSQCFFQKHLTESMPGTLRGIEIEEKDKHSTYVVLDDLAGLISLVQMSVLELHPWPARADRLDRPDQLVFDLDPGIGTPWKMVVQGANDLRHTLNELGLQSFLRTSGGKGLHVVVPLDRRSSWEELKQFAKGVADQLTRQFPARYLATASKSRRKGKVFIDYLRNQRGATAIATYSTRARPNAPVATPIRWDELSNRLKPNQYTVENLQKRLISIREPVWPDFFEIRQSITKSMLEKVRKQD